MKRQIQFYQELFIPTGMHWWIFKGHFHIFILTLNFYLVLDHTHSKPMVYRLDRKCQIFVQYLRHFFPFYFLFFKKIHFLYFSSYFSWFEWLEKWYKVISLEPLIKYLPDFSSCLAVPFGGASLKNA